MSEVKIDLTEMKRVPITLEERRATLEQRISYRYEDLAKLTKSYNTKSSILKADILSIERELGLIHEQVRELKNE